MTIEEFQQYMRDDQQNGLIDILTRIVERARPEDIGYRVANEDPRTQTSWVGWK